jgi:hypothetical protein
MAKKHRKELSTGVFGAFAYTPSRKKAKSKGKK